MTREQLHALVLYIQASAQLEIQGVSGDGSAWEAEGEQREKLYKAFGHDLHWDKKEEGK